MLFGVKVLGIVWTGVQTRNFDDMAAFMERLVGMPAAREDLGFRLWSFPDGDILELYAEGGKPTFGDAPVVGFRWMTWRRVSPASKRSAPPLSAGTVRMRTDTPAFTFERPMETSTS
jgi:hypothetical protein